MVTCSSESGFAETLSNLLRAISDHGLLVFAQIDHAAAAKEVGLEMAPEVVVVFGNARAGTPLMQSDPQVGIELPLKLLLWETDGVAKVAYHDPRDLARTYSLGDQIATLEAMAQLLATLTREATR